MQFSIPCAIFVAFCLYLKAVNGKKLCYNNQFNSITEFKLNQSFLSFWIIVNKILAAFERMKKKMMSFLQFYQKYTSKIFIISFQKFKFCLIFKADNCEVNFCLNGGTCSVNSFGQQYCICPSGVSGNLCQDGKL